MTAARAAAKLAGFVVLSLFLMPFQALVCVFGTGKALYVLPNIYHNILCRMFGLKVRTVGVPVRERPVLYAANHLSYLDILVFSSLIPVSFVAKKDVADWPFFGLLARLQKTVFVDRARSAIRTSERQVQIALSEGRPLMLFPEGTSSDGRCVLPFRSSLFGPLESFPGTLVQPVTLRLEGEVSQARRDAYAWYGDMDLLPHLWAFARSRGACVWVVFHEPLTTQNRDRKTLARLAQEAVETGGVPG